MSQLPSYRLLRQADEEGRWIAVTTGSPERPVWIQRYDPDSVDYLDFGPVERALSVVRRAPHPQVPELVGADLKAPAPYVAMAYEPGESLRRALARARRAQRRLPACRVVEAVQHIAAAVGHLYQQGGVLCRYLDPGQIHLTRRRGAQLLGLYDAPLHHRQNVTGQVRLARPLRYLSPEAALGQTLGPASDVFVLGSILWEGLSGASPFQGDSDLDTLMRIARAPAPPFPAQELGLLPALGAVLARALQREPAARYPHAGELAAALAALQPLLLPQPAEGIAEEWGEPPVEEAQVLGGFAAGGLRLAPCPMAWEALTPTQAGGQERRFCARCQREVVRVEGEAGLLQAAAAGECAHVPAAPGLRQRLRLRWSGR